MYSKSDITPKILVNGVSDFSLNDSIINENECEKPRRVSSTSLSDISVIKRQLNGTEFTSNLPGQRETSIILIHPKPSFTEFDQITSTKHHRHHRHRHTRNHHHHHNRRRSTISNCSHHSRRRSRSHSKVSAMSNEIEMDAATLEKERRHRFIVSVIMGTFIFIVVASVLVVVITLTNHKPLTNGGENGGNGLSLNTGPRRFQHHNILITHSTTTNNPIIRKENEQLMHSLNYNNHAHNFNKSILLTTLAPEIVPA